MFRQRTTENVVINVGLQWFNRILGIVSRVVLAYFLGPPIFGLFAIGTGLIGFVGTFGNFGLDYAIIQKGQAATDEDYDVGMTLRLMITAGLFIVSFLVAGPWASLFPKFPYADVTSTTQFIAIVYLITPWSFVPGTRLTQELRYRAIAIPNLVGQIANALISIAMAALGFGVWALVYGMVVAQLLSTVGFVLIRGAGFHFKLRRDVARPLLSYSQPLIVAALLTFLITNIDNFTVGRLLGDTSLGLYALAYSFGYLPVSLLSTPAGGALFPSLTRIQNDLPALRDAYLESFSYVIVLIAPAALGLSMMAPEIVHILFLPEWANATGPMLVLGFYGLGRGLVDFSSSLFAAVGKPRIIAIQNLYILVLSVILLVPLTLEYFILGTSVAMTIPVLIVAVVSLRQSAKTLHGRLTDFVDRLWGPLLAAEAMALFLFAFRMGMYAVLPGRIELPIGGLSLSEVTLVLLLGIPFGMLVYFAFLRILDPKVYQGVLHHIGLVVGGLPHLSR